MSTAVIRLLTVDEPMNPNLQYLLWICVLYWLMVVTYQVRRLEDQINELQPRGREDQIEGEHSQVGEVEESNGADSQT